MALLLRQCVILSAAEDTIGTPQSLLAANGAFIAYVGDDFFTPDIQIDERPGPRGLAQLPAVPGARMARIKFSTDLVGGSGVPAWASTFLPPCGMQDDGNTFRFEVGGTIATRVTNTIAVYVDGTVYKIAGAMGTYTIRKTAAKQGMVDFDFLGKMIDDADAALPSPTFPTTIPPRWSNNAFTIGAFAPKCETLTISPNNELTMLMDQDDDNDTGRHSTIIVDRKPSGELDPEASLVATKNWLADLKASTEAAFSSVIGSAVNNTITIASAKAQVIDPSLGSREKVLTRNLKIQFNGSTPFSIAFS